jgi:hypothetical protein
LDRGFVSYDVLGELVKYCAEQKGRSHFLMPAIRSRVGTYSENEEVASNVLSGIEAVARQGYEKSRAIGRTGSRYFVIERPIKDHQAFCNLIIFYEPKPEAFEPHITEWRLGQQVSYVPFLTDIEVTDENVEEIHAPYSMRWNCENLYQKLNKIMGILPSRDLYPRLLSFGLAFGAMTPYAIKRVQEFEGEAQHDRDLLTRLIPFFHVGRTQLYRALHP